MRYQSKAFIICCLLGAAISLGLTSCASKPSTAPENNLAAQSTPSPVATPAPSPTIEDLTPPPPSIPDTAVAGSSSVSRPGSSSRSNAATSRRNVAPAPEPAPARAPQPRSYTLPAGTAISISTETDLSTKKNKSGDRFTGSLESDLVSGDYTIARRGSPVEGVVVETDPGGRVSGVASMSVKLESLTLADGRRVKLSTNSYTKEAKSSKKKDAVKVGGGAGVGAAIGAIAGGGKGAAIGAIIGGGAGTGAVLATRGDPAVISSESQLTFRLNSPVTVTRR